jgi:serine/threonine protein phosphatase PrpC
MTVERSAGRTDPGRRRRHNEDAFICEPPLFAVADGMGGAQAGELASRLAAAAVGQAELDERTGSDRVTALLREANRSVYERAAGDASVSGMGTTMTVAIVEDGGVWIGHVGDSRAYLVRGGRLDQVTEDHSLVAELVRSGRLTPDEADHHPHRSVITRALGTEPDVDVDTFFVEPQAGDVFLLCSDGLTTMVDGPAMLALIEAHRADLDRAAQALVEAANAAGGEDNITVVLFEIDGAGDSLEDTAELGLAAAGADEDTLHGVPSPLAGSVAEAERPVHDDPAGGAVATRIALSAAGIAVVALGALAVLGLARSHFVGAEDDGRVAVYQGVPWELGLGVKLYRVVWQSPLLAANLSQPERRSLFDHDLMSRSAAETRVEAYAEDVVP